MRATTDLEHDFAPLVADVICSDRTGEVCDHLCLTSSVASSADISSTGVAFFSLVGIRLTLSEVLVENSHGDRKMGRIERWRLWRSWDGGGWCQWWGVGGGGGGECVAPVGGR
ncbi:hypothetical protein AKJ16_DCAP06559 [Drosera capensis]